MRINFYNEMFYREDKKERALELLGEVNKKGTEAIHGEHKRSTSETMEELVNCTKVQHFTKYY